MSNTNNHNKSAGFTLIELLVYLSLVSGILVAATTFAWNIINARTKSFAIQEVEQNGRFIMERLSREIRQATKIGEPTIGADSKQLQFSTRDSSADPTIVWIDGSQLFIKRGDGEPLVFSSKDVVISNIRFSNYSFTDDRSRAIQVELTVEHRNPDNRQEWQASETFMTSIELRDR